MSPGTLGALLLPLGTLLLQVAGNVVVAGVLLWLLRSERRRAARPAAPEPQHLRLLYEQLPVIAWSVDRDLRFLSSAGSGLRAVGLAAGEVVGLSLETFLGDDPIAASMVDLHRRASTGETVVCDTSWRGHEFHVRLEPLRDAEGDIAGCVGVALDVTEQRRIEASYSETQRLESLGVLAGGVAHDLANLITGVVGHAELALARLPPDAPARSALERAIEGAERCGDLAHQVLAYAGRAETRRAPLELGKLVRGMGDLLRVSISPRCAVRYELGERLPSIEADAAQLRQIVLNLMTNGAEAMGDCGGTLTVAIAARRLTAAELSSYQFGGDLPAGDYVALSVADTGAGMTAEVRGRIFEPFFTTKQAGRGLGLAAVLGIVRAHGGAIRVASEPGLGTTFEVLFPAPADEAQLAS